MAANDNSEKSLSNRPMLSADTWRFAESIIRERGPMAYVDVQRRVEKLKREGNDRVAKLWRDVAEAIKWLQGRPGAGPM